MWIVVLLICIGVLVGAVALAINISKRKEVEKAIQSSSNVETKAKGQSLTIPNWMCSMYSKIDITFTSDAIQFHAVDSVMETYSKVNYADIKEYQFKQDKPGSIYFTIVSNKLILMKFAELEQWKTINGYNANKINFYFEFPARISEGDRILQNLKNLIASKLESFVQSDKGKEIEKIKDNIENLPFVISFKNHFGCTIDEFLSKTKKTDCENGYLIAGTGKNTSDGNKYIFINAPEFNIFAVLCNDPILEPEKEILINIIQDKQKYFEILKKADFNKFLNNWHSYDEIEEIAYIKNISHNTLTKQTPSGLSLAVQSELIHPLYAVGSILESQEGIDMTNDLSQYCIKFKSLPVGQVYIFAEIFKMDKDLVHLADIYPSK